MATTRGSLGREVVFAFDQATTWGTAVTLGALDGIPLLEKGIGRAVEPLKDEAAGYTWLQNVLYGNETVTFGPKMDFRFGCGPMLKMLVIAMGSYTYQGQQGGGGSTAYLHEFRLATDPWGKFGTAGVQYQVGDVDDVWEYPSVKVGGFTLEGTAGDVLKLTPAGIANKCVRTSPVNTDLDSVSYQGLTTRVQFVKCKLELGPVGGAYVQVYPSSCVFNFNRNVSAEHLAQQGTSSMEPTGEGLPTLDVTVNFPEYGHRNLLETLTDAWFAETQFKFKLTYTGASLGGTPTQYETVTLEMATAHIVSDDPQVSGPNRIPESITLMGLDPTGATLPFTLDIINSISSAIWT